MTGPLFATGIYWHFPFLIIVVSLVYSATRYEHWNNIVAEALRWAWRMTGFLCGVGLLMYILTLFL